MVKEYKIKRRPVMLKGKEIKRRKNKNRDVLEEGIVNNKINKDGILDMLKKINMKEEELARFLNGVDYLIRNSIVIHNNGISLKRGKIEIIVYNKEFKEKEIVFIRKNKVIKRGIISKEAEEHFKQILYG